MSLVTIYSHIFPSRRLAWLCKYIYLCIITSHGKTKNLNELANTEIKLTEDTSHKKYRSKLRLVRFHDPEQERDFNFLTNATHLMAL